MKSDELRRENAALRERMSRLSAAILRISASLDLDTVLREIVESARALTGARVGVIATVDENGQVRDFVTSGFTAAEQQQLAAWPDGQRLFAHLRDLPGPLRVPDLHDYVRSLGLPADLLPPTKTMQGTSMRHRGVLVGNFFLGDKEGGGEFTSEDEDVLVLFASQAAAAIANARTYRREQRARADLEALVETSPVGVAVFDGRTGNLVSLNREAKRIVSGLRQPGGSAEELLGLLTSRRADGREVSLREVPLAQQLGNAETVRAEEIELSVPDGRRVRTLINATPILGEDGGVESVVVTMQDLAPLEELERVRTEFLALVSHELRAPLSSVIGSTATLLRDSTRLGRAEMREFFRLIDEQAHHMRSLIGDLLDAGRVETGTLSVDLEPSEVAGLVDQARKTFLSGGGRHPVRIDLPRDLPRVMADRERIVQVLNNLLSNAARHAPETSPIRITAAPDGTHVAVSVSDEGPGVPPDQLPHLFRKHVGGARGAGERGLGRYGLGLAICKGLVEAHGGRILAESAGPGQGTRVTFTIPSAAETGRDAPADGSLPGGSPAREPRQETRILVVDDDPQTLRHVRDALRPPRDGRAAGRARAAGDAQAPPGPAGPDAAGGRRHRADGDRPRAVGPAGHLPLRLRPGRDDCARPGDGRRRLHRQAVLTDGADRESPGGPAEDGRPRGLRAGGPGHRLRAAPGDGGRPRGAADGHRVRGGPCALGPRRPRDDPRFAAAPGLDRPHVP